jgi:hypothetical protein
VRWGGLVHFFLKVVFVFFGYVSSSLGSVYFLRQSAIRTRMISVPYDNSVSGRGTRRTPSNLRVQQADPCQSSGARRSKSLPSSSLVYFSPRFSLVVRPVLIRHRSMASRRPTATMALFLVAPVALGWSNTGRHLRSGGYSG